MNLSVKIGKLTMQNPVTVASGTFGYGAEYARLIDLNLLGAVTVKGIRLNPVPGNPTPRTAETASGMLNAIGLQGPGVDGFIKKYWPFLKGLKVPTIINIWGTTVEEYAEVARRIAKFLRWRKKSGRSVPARCCQTARPPACRARRRRASARCRS